MLIGRWWLGHCPMPTRGWSRSALLYRTMTPHLEIFAGPNCPETLAEARFADTHQTSRDARDGIPYGSKRATIGGRRSVGARGPTSVLAARGTEGGSRRGFSRQIARGHRFRRARCRRVPCRSTPVRGGPCRRCRRGQSWHWRLPRGRLRGGAGQASIGQLVCTVSCLRPLAIRLGTSYLPQRMLEAEQPR